MTEDEQLAQFVANGPYTSDQMRAMLAAVMRRELLTLPTKTESPSVGVLPGGRSRRCPACAYWQIVIWGRSLSSEQHYCHRGDAMWVITWTEVL